MIKEPFIAHSELTHEIYVVVGKEKYCVTEQAIKAVAAIKALEKEPTTKNDLAVDNQNIRLIDANALIKRLRPKHFDWWGEGEQDDFSKGNNSMLEEVIEAIEEFPSVTPIRPKGHWIDHSDEGYVECSECGSATNCDGNIADLHFCFSCGAEMESE